MTHTPTTAATEMRTSALIARVWSQYLAPQKGLLGFAIACAVVVALTTTVLVGWLDPAINLLFHVNSANDRITPHLPDWLTTHPLISVPAVIIVFGLLRFAGQRGLTTTLNHVGNQLVGRIQEQLFSRLVRADLGHLQKAHSGQYLSSVLYDADQVRDAASTGLVQYIQALLLVIGNLAFMFWTDWSMTLVVLLAGPVIGAVMGKYLKATRKAAQGAMAETSTLSTAVMESLDGVKIVKIANQEAAEEMRVGEVINRRQRFLIKGANARSMAAPATEVLTAFLLAGLLAFAGWRAQAGHLTVAGLFAYIAALGTASQALRQLAGLQGTFTQGMTAARRLFRALDIEPEITETADAKPLSRNFKAITFDHAGFSYGDAPVLRDVSFVARAGESIALVGPSGSGKSTLLNLLPRFFDLTAGDIRFDDLSHRDIAITALRSRIALVTQDPFLFDDTIRANIAYGNACATAEQIEQAATDAAADDFIRALPQGYDTRVGEAGSRLSGGQKQRIAIARAFLKDAPLLLLDEATSALDTQSEIKVQEALERLMTGRTTFIIAHRLSTIRHADQILVLDAGEIVERGTHDQLIRAGGLYASLAATQFGEPVAEVAQ
ncbi:ABC transporter ATP-binding protein [Asticcacaulis sp.]|uniref:ABC transporter ATP-binding protein n=1 Tax=Asticcacaulis sp. TaxID=1872648 RepID=UPI002D0A51BC|nr:ABC transporter transmembrane domain-containing protein [Asticcacaulis sp.]HTM81706.1 ABC transporter transmembrane domain-containing protein [Asticcacaulis sp.]